MRFFLDNTLPPRFAEVLNLLEGNDGHAVVHLQSKFRVETKDIDWIKILASEGNWIIVSGDIRISQNEFERKEWLNSGLTAFFFAKGWTAIKLWDQAWRLVKWWPAIVEQAERIQPGAGFIVPLKSTKLVPLRV